MLACQYGNKNLHTCIAKGRRGKKFYGKTKETGIAFLGLM